MPATHFPNTSWHLGFDGRRRGPPSLSYLQTWILPRFYSVKMLELSFFLLLWAPAVHLFLDLLSRSGTEAGTLQRQGTAATSGGHPREAGLLLAWVGLLPVLPYDFRQMINLEVSNFCSCPPAVRADDLTGSHPHLTVGFSQDLPAEALRASATTDSMVASSTRSRRQAGREPCHGLFRQLEPACFHSYYHPVRGELWGVEVWHIYGFS